MRCGSGRAGLSKKSQVNTNSGCVEKRTTPRSSGAGDMLTHATSSPFTTCCLQRAYGSTRMRTSTPTAPNAARTTSFA